MFFRLLLLTTFFCSALVARPIVLVSIAPLKFFVEQIAGDTVDVIVLVPPGASPHSFEPTAKQLILASKADIWFRIGEPFEKRAIDVLTSHHPSIEIVDTRKNITLLAGGCKHCEDSGDTHIWLSPKCADTQSLTIKEALVAKYLENREPYEQNYQKLYSEIEELDLELSECFKNSSVKAILVSHPAFGYFCEDYHIKQLSIEVEGKDPTPRQLTELLKLAKSLKIDTVYAQEQYQTKGAYLIAKELNAKVYIVDPYSSDYINNLRYMGKLFSNCHDSH